MIGKIGLRVTLSVREILVLLVVALLVLGFGPLKASEQAKSLSNASTVRVLVKIGISRQGPAKDMLQKTVENKLRKENVKIWEEDIGESHDPPSSLFVEVAVWKMPGRPYVYFVNANFYQSVQLSGNEGITTQAATWQTGLIGEGDLDRIQQDVDKITNIFIAAYKKNNSQTPS